jgi:hypothetical protein
MPGLRAVKRWCPANGERTNCSRTTKRSYVEVYSAVIALVEHLDHRGVPTSQAHFSAVLQTYLVIDLEKRRWMPWYCRL